MIAFLKQHKKVITEAGSILANYIDGAYDNNKQAGNEKRNKASKQLEKLGLEYAYVDASGPKILFYRKREWNFYWWRSWFFQKWTRCYTYNRRAWRTNDDCVSDDYVNFLKSMDDPIRGRCTSHLLEVSEDGFWEVFMGKSEIVEGKEINNG